MHIPCLGVPEQTYIIIIRTYVMRDMVQVVLVSLAVPLFCHVVLLHERVHVCGTHEYAGEVMAHIQNILPHRSNDGIHVFIGDAVREVPEVLCPLVS